MRRWFTVGLAFMEGGMIHWVSYPGKAKMKNLKKYLRHIQHNGLIVIGKHGKIIRDDFAQRI